MLTIIVPCYNVSHKFNALEPLRSIRDQRVDVIFVDDGSTDRTLQMLEGLELGIKKKIIQSPNRGPGAARNIGVSATHSDYIWFVDADDRPVPEPVLRRLTEILQLKADVAMFQAVCGRELLSSRWSHSWDMYERFANYGIIRNKLFNRSFLERNDIRFAESYSSEDNAFVLKAGELQSNALFYDDVIYEVLLTEDSICRGPFSPRYMTRWDAVEDMLDFARTHPRPGLRRLEREMMFLSLSLTWSYYLERNRLQTLLPLLPRLLARLRRWGLLRHLDLFLASGSVKNRAAKLAAISAALPLSLAVRSD